MDQTRIHPSHDASETDEGAPEPHSSGWRCRVCLLYTCMFCALGDSMDDAELERPCPGGPHY